MPLRFLCDASATALQQAREASGVTLAAACYLTSPPIIAAVLSPLDSGRHRSPSHCSATRPRSLCDAPAHETATPIRLTALRRLWAGSSADYINRPHRLARLQGVLSTRHTPLRNDQCALHVLLGSGTGDRSYLLVGTGASHVNYRHGADRCSVAGTGGWGPDP